MGIARHAKLTNYMVYEESECSDGFRWPELATLALPWLRVYTHVEVIPWTTLPGGSWT